MAWPFSQGVSGDTEGWIQQAQGWLPSCRTHRLLAGSGAEHAAVWGDGAAIDPLHMARQHLDLPPWGQQKCVTRREQDSLALLSLPFPSGNLHWLGIPWVNPKAMPSCISEVKLWSLSQGCPLLPQILSPKVLSHHLPSQDGFLPLP